MTTEGTFQDYWQNCLFHRSGQVPDLQTQANRDKYAVEERAARDAWYTAIRLMKTKLAEVALELS
jgi:hypothetical protein